MITGNEIFMKTIAIVQARIGSTRLPGKILKKIGDKIVLDYVLERLKLCKYLDEIVLATTTSEKDDILEAYAKNKGIRYFRGSEEDVLSRYYLAAKHYNADIIVRITSDCPLIDPEIVDAVVKKHIENKADYTANVVTRTFPRGLDTEVFNFSILEDTYKNAIAKDQREHVTTYMLMNVNKKYKICSIEAKGKLRRPDIRITLDTEEDFELLKRILLHFKNFNFKSEDVITFLDQNPNLLEINRHIKQKE